MITQGIFWIIISFSDGKYNRGNMDQLDVLFKTEASCQLTLEEINKIYKPEWGHYADCVKVDNR